MSRSQRNGADLPSALARSDLAASVLLANPSVDPNVSVASVHELFAQNRHLTCLPMVENGIPVGIVRRYELQEMLAQRYARELFYKKRIKNFSAINVIIIPDSTPLEVVSRLLTDEDSDELQQEFIITHDGKYLGIGKTQHLLRRITDRQIQNARYANPLTGLPGNVPIDEEIDRCLSNQLNFHIAYLDLDNFKPFNDHYGFARGDDVIKRTAEIIESEVAAEDFVGHVGGDDFVAIMFGDHWKACCDRILEAFRAVRKAFYDEADLKAGAIRVKNRTGEYQDFPLLGLSIGVVNPDPVKCSNYLQVVSLCSDAKKEAKKLQDKSLYVSRRRSCV